MASTLTSTFSSLYDSAARLLGSAFGPLKSATEAAWDKLGARWLNFAVPLEGKIGGMLTHTLLTSAVFWSSYLVFYNFYRAIDKQNLWGLRKFKIHPDRDENQELNDKVTGGLKKGWWLGVARTATMYYVFFSNGRQPVNSFPKAPWELFYKMVVGYFVFDFGFYWLHRMEHLPYFYKWMHKQHHEFKVTNSGATSWNAAYESFGIMLVGNLNSLLFKFDLFTWLCWTLWANYLDFHVHCGYNFPYNPANLVIDPPVHDFHHFQNRGNFATSHWDMIFGTNKNWLEWKAKQEARKAQGLAEETERRTDDDDEEEALKAGA